MAPAAAGDAPAPRFDVPTSVLAYGPSPLLLHWVVYSFIRLAEGGYFWTDVRFLGQAADPDDPVERGVIPKDRAAVRDPRDFPPNDAPANAAVTVGLRPDQRPAQVEELSDSLRLPSLTQHLIESRRSPAGPLVLVVANAHRMAPLYTPETARVITRAMLARGATLVLTFSDEPPALRFLFENSWHIDGRDPRSWREATLTVEQASPAGPIPRTGAWRLEALPNVASVLAGVFDQKA